MYGIKKKKYSSIIINAIRLKPAEIKHVLTETVKLRTVKPPAGTIRFHTTKMNELGQRYEFNEGNVSKYFFTDNGSDG